MDSRQASVSMKARKDSHPPIARALDVCGGSGETGESFAEGRNA
ncbi:MAG TPA: hypothetical protein VGT03_06485 [Candidatus Acidoferrales bacterium]|nr:hypothetical protein [Candidatus Acidoferrales bacterium]